jgi:CRP-like cAMP-binding protein
MYEFFFRKFKETVPLTMEEQEHVKTFLTPKKLRKKQYLLQEGDACKYIAFVEKGVLRSYTIDENGGEHILQFALEGWLISDLSSFLTGEPADYAIDALEDCELVLISRSANEELMRTFPKYESWMRELITAAYIALQRRITSIISQSVENRYNSLTATYPHIVQRVPQHMIASFMGVTPETLSRVRKKLSAGR